jgi:hypothetical protein
MDVTKTTQRLAKKGHFSCPAKFTPSNNQYHPQKVFKFKLGKMQYKIIQNNEKITQGISINMETSTILLIADVSIKQKRSDQYMTQKL